MKLSGYFAAAACACMLVTSPALAQTPNWVVSWAAGEGAQDTPTGEAIPAAGITYRNIIHMSLGGSRVRVRFSNQHGTESLKINAATIAKRDGAADSILATSRQTLTFNGGATTVTIAPGDEIYSDPAPLAVGAGEDLAVSFFLPKQTISLYTSHFKSFQVSYFAAGNQAANKNLTSPTNYRSWHFATAVDVDAPAGSQAIVAIGDSITDGTGSDLNQNNRWPNLLFNTLNGQASTDHLAVVNTGIGSDRILYDGGLDDGSGRVGITPALYKRWGYDAMNLSGVKTIILLEGINDVGHYNNQTPNTTAQMLIDKMIDLVTRAHNHVPRINVIGGTLTPFYNKSGYYSVAAEDIRNDVNAWIRSAAAPFDGVIDFEQCVRGTTTPTAWRPNITLDQLHPNAQGEPVLANCAAGQF